VSVRSIGEPSSPLALDLGRFTLMSARWRLLAEIVDTLMKATPFVALTGPPGVGKTILAGMIQKELSKRSVNVQWVDGGGGSGIHLRTIMVQFFGKPPETDVDADDIERLFEVMTERAAPNARLALIIDDAEQLLPDALGYLRLLASIAKERMPQIVFVGNPSFWQIAGQAAEGGFADLITARFELGLLSPQETRTTAEQLMAALSLARGPVLDPCALEAVVQRSEGLISRLVPTLETVETIARERHQIRVTTAVVDAATARLESKIAIPLDGSFAPQLELGSGAIVGPVVASTAPEKGTNAANGTSRALIPSLNTHRDRSFMRIAGAVAVMVGAIGVAIYWLTPFGIDRIWAERQTALWYQGDVEPVSVSTIIMVQLPTSAVALQVQSGSSEAESSNAPSVTDSVATGVSREWGDDDMGGTIGRSIVDWGNADAMGVAVDCDRG